MKKQITLFAVILLCVVMVMGCGSSAGSEIRISFSGTPEVHEQKFVSGSETVSFHGTISVIGSANLRVLSAGGDELYNETFDDVHSRELAIEVTGLTPGGEYTLLLDGTGAISCTLVLSTEQKLVSDIPSPTVTAAEK